MPMRSSPVTSRTTPVNKVNQPRNPTENAVATTVLPRTTKTATTTRRPRTTSQAVRRCSRTSVLKLCLLWGAGADVGQDERTRAFSCWKSRLGGRGRRLRGGEPRVLLGVLHGLLARHVPADSRRRRRRRGTPRRTETPRGSPHQHQTGRARVETPGEGGQVDVVEELVLVVHQVGVAARHVAVLELDTVVLPPRPCSRRRRRGCGPSRTAAGRPAQGRLRADPTSYGPVESTSASCWSRSPARPRCWGGAPGGSRRRPACWCTQTSSGSPRL